MLEYDRHFVKNYQHAIETMHTEEKVVLLYEKAISCVKRAKEAIENNNSQESYEQLEKTSKIINALRESIEIQANTRDLAQSLHDYYNALDLLIVSIESTRDLSSCDKAITNLRVLYDAWEQKISSLKEQDDGQWINIRDLRTII